MSSPRKLPIVFWLLLAGAFFIGAVLLVATLEENKTSVQKLFVDTKSDKPKPNQKNEDTTIQEGPDNNSCKIKELKIPTQSELLAYWDPNPTDFSFWTLHRKSQTLKKWTIKEHNDSITFEPQEGKIDLLCAKRQEEGCIFPGTRSLVVSQVAAIKNLGWLELKDKDGKSDFVWMKIENNGVIPYQKIGFCGRDLPKDTKLSLVNKKDLTWIMAINKNAGLILGYSPYELRNFSDQEIPQHPSTAITAQNESLVPLNCQNLTNFEPIHGYSQLGAKIALLQNKGFLKSNGIVHVASLINEQFQAVESLSEKQIGANIDQVSWQSDETLALLSVNFFRTAFSMFFFDTHSKVLSSRREGEVFPSHVILTREELQNEQPKTRLEILTAIDQGEKQFCRVPGKNLVPLPLEIDHEDPVRWMASERAPGRFLILAQKDPGLPARAFFLDCSSY